MNICINDSETGFNLKNLNLFYEIKFWMQKPIVDPSNISQKDNLSLNQVTTSTFYWFLFMDLSTSLKRAHMVPKLLLFQ